MDYKLRVLRKLQSSGIEKPVSIFSLFLATLGSMSIPVLNKLGFLLLF